MTSADNKYEVTIVCEYMLYEGSDWCITSLTSHSLTHISHRRSVSISKCVKVSQISF